MITVNFLLYKALQYHNYSNLYKNFVSKESLKASTVEIDTLLAIFNISKKNCKSINQFTIPTDKNITVESIYSTSKHPKLMNRFEYEKP